MRSKLTVGCFVLSLTILAFTIYLNTWAFGRIRTLGMLMITDATEWSLDFTLRGKQPFETIFFRANHTIPEYSYPVEIEITNRSEQEILYQRIDLDAEITVPPEWLSIRSGGRQTVYEGPLRKFSTPLRGQDPVARPEFTIRVKFEEQITSQNQIKFMAGWSDGI